jgi:hypothetical protein
MSSKELDIRVRTAEQRNKEAPRLWAALYVEKLLLERTLSFRRDLRRVRLLNKLVRVRTLGYFSSVEVDGAGAETHLRGVRHVEVTQDWEEL